MSVTQWENASTLGKLAQWDSASAPKKRASWLNFTDALNQAIGPNLVTRLPITFAKNQIKVQ